MTDLGLDRSVVKLVGVDGLAGLGVAEEPLGDGSHCVVSACRERSVHRGRERAADTELVDTGVAQGNYGFFRTGIIAAWAAWRFDFYTVKSLKS